MIAGAREMGFSGLRCDGVLLALGLGRVIREWVLCLLAVALLCAPRMARAQGSDNTDWDLGAGLGLTGYTGDLNLSPLPRAVSVHLNALARYQLSEWYALRVNLLGGGINGRYNEARYFLPEFKKERPDQFHHYFFALDISAEVHFMPFQVTDFSQKRENDRFIAPYVTAGIGGGAVLQYGVGLYVPFGGGVKIALGDRVTLAPELRFLKFFSDRADGYENWPSGGGFAIHNADWISMLSVTCTYRFLISGPRCPAYR